MGAAAAEGCADGESAPAPCAPGPLGSVPGVSCAAGIAGSALAGFAAPDSSSARCARWCPRKAANRASDGCAAAARAYIAASASAWAAVRRRIPPSVSAGPGSEQPAAAGTAASRASGKRLRLVHSTDPTVLSAASRMAQMARGALGS